MPDWSIEPLKYNPNGGVGSGNTTDDANEPTSDWTGWALAGGPLGRLSYQHITDILAGEGSPLANAGTPGVMNQVTAEGRIADTDGTGIFILGHGVKYASGGSAASPGMVFPISVSAIGASQVMKVNAVFSTNGVAIPDTASIDVGFYPVTVGGAGGALAYTLSTTGQIVENYGDGIAASSIYGRDNPDRRADFVSGGDKNYAMGVNIIGGALPTGAVVDVELALGVTPY